MAGYYRQSNINTLPWYDDTIESKFDRVMGSVEKKNGIVHVVFYLKMKNNALTNDTPFLQLPLGWRPKFGAYYHGIAYMDMLNPSSAHGFFMRVETNGRVFVLISANSYALINFSYPVVDD